MNNELKLHIKKLKNRATLSLISYLLVFISIGFGILCLFVPSYVAIIFLVITIISIAYLFYSNRVAKKELREAKYEPVIFKADSNISFKEIVAIFEQITDKENKLSTSENVLFFRLNRIFKLRTILYRTTDYDKKDFDNAKDRINKKANRELNISPWVNRFDAGNMMRFNIIHTDTLNDTLYQLVSQNANRNLARVEGIINIAIIGNQIIIPPIYGDCDLVEISRYKNIIKFINQILLGK